MAVEVVYNVADEWLEELAYDALDGLVDRRIARVTITRKGETDGPLDRVLIHASYSAQCVAVRLERTVGFIPRSVRFGSDMDAEKVGERTTASCAEMEERIRELGIRVRAGRLVTVG